MSGVFVNYRSGPHSISVAALADRLVRHFGEDLVFVDHQMTSGTRYPDELRARVRSCDVLVAVVHEGWDQEWRDDVDWVRFEIATALEDGKHVVPVLLEDTAQLTPSRLPDDVRDLAMRQSARLRAARWAEDVTSLLAQLDAMVEPTVSARPVPTPKPHRVPLRAAGWAALLFFLSFAQYHETSPPWLIYPTMTLASLFAMIACVLLTAVPFSLNHRFHPVERRVGGMPFRRYAQRSWIAVALIVIIVAVSLIDFATAGGTWRIGVALAVVVGLIYQAHQLWLKRSDEDTAWPPPVSPEPIHFRRAAVRLHEKLTTSETPRSRSLQAQAVGMYLALAETRLALHVRSHQGWRPLLAAGHYKFAAFFLGWATSIVVLDLITLTDAPARWYPICAAILVLAPGFAALAIWLELRAGRAHAGRHVDELTEWQAKLGPLVFDR